MRCAASCWTAAGCRLKAADGTTLYLPDGRAHYQALWTRDFAYMVRYAGDLMPPEDIRACIEYLLRGQRADGVIPDRVEPDGTPVYVAGGKDHPIGEYNLDNAQFLIFAAEAYLSLAAEASKESPIQRWFDPMLRGLNTIPLGERGLVYNPPDKPHSPYGFTDTVGKTGDLLMESLLYWEAARILARWAEALGRTSEADVLRGRIAGIESGVGGLWSDADGAYFAASKDCRQIDVWTNAYAIAIGFPLGDHRGRVLDFLVANYGRYVSDGQVRHLLTPEHWQRMLARVEPDRYQNGAYWAAASGWVIQALTERDPALARRTFDDLARYFRERGIFECVHGDYRQLDSYVVSATNPRAAARALGY